MQQHSEQVVCLMFFSDRTFSDAVTVDTNVIRHHVILLNCKTVFLWHTPVWGTQFILQKFSKVKQWYHLQFRKNELAS